MLEVNLADISPIHNPHVAAVVGAHFQYTADGIRTAYALECALDNTADTFLIKVPVEIGLQKCHEINARFSSGSIILGVHFDNLHVYRWHFDGKSGYTGTADDFLVVT